ncbi:alkyl/aryl-sulfatase [Sphingomonas sp.]|uniref:alkyl/aryl-sulfatase n=1 Tax=Sphingomonas sp. TaxID=28214 RepID=UPI003CC5C45B
MTRNDATAATCAAQARAAAALPREDDAFALADRGFVATIEHAEIPGIWSQRPYAFVEGDAPATVHPGLWRQAKLNGRHGLYEVVPGIWQVRGFDLSTVTFVRGESGWIVIDPLTSAEPAAAALALANAQLGERPVTAVIYTHCHVDHYGGIRGVLPPGSNGAGCPIYAPEGFLKHAVSENVLCGNVMGRRATYMYGATLPIDAQGHVDCGLGKAVSRGTVGLVPPTVSITRTGERHVVDGVEIVFQLTPDTEAPAEMNFYFPASRALCIAENCTCHLHNLYTPRGAPVRDARNWSRYIDEALRLWGGEAEALFASHHWPRWGGDAIRRFLLQQRDLYKLIHDQTLRLANHGLGPAEIAEQLALPPGLAAEWHTRGFYGTLNHNAKAVYQRYLGAFDGNPATLHPLPRVEAGRRYVAACGGAAALLATARAAYDAGDYRWVAELVNHLVFADPADADARALQADALEQLGYQAESGPWRDFYLSGAKELRAPLPKSGTPRQGSLNQLRALPAGQLLEALAVRVDAARAEDNRFVLGFTDTGEAFEVELSNGVLHHRPAKQPIVSLARPTLIALVGGEQQLGDAAVEGDSAPLARLLACLDRFDFWFPLVEPLT